MTAVLTCAAPTGAFGAPVHLRCDWWQGKVLTHYDYTLDEQRGTAALYVEETDHAETDLPVVFTPDLVILYPKYSRARISRRTLDYLFQFTDKDPPQTWQGKCQVQDAPHRLF